MNRIPTHTCTVYFPDGSTDRHTCHPIGQDGGRYWCKYCSQTHSNWWQMRREDYGEDVLLCGECEHTSLKENL